MSPEIDQLQLLNTITEIRVELGKLSTRLEKLDDFTRSLDELRRQMQDLARKSGEVEDVANKALESTKAAHHRLNGVSKVAWWILTATGGTTITMIVSFALKGGFVK